jgi:Uma2 family endonuclease
MQFGALLLNHVKPRKLGGVGTEAGFTLSRNPDTVRAPDVAFIRQDRLSSSRPRGFWQGAPDLAVEVLSPDDSAADVATKVQEYLGFGVPLVLVIDPRTQIVTTHRRSATSVTLNAPDALIDLSDVVPGFRCTVAEIFE